MRQRSTGMAQVRYVFRDIGPSLAKDVRILTEGDHSGAGENVGMHAPEVSKTVPDWRATPLPTLWSVSVWFDNFQYIGVLRDDGLSAAAVDDVYICGRTR